MDPELKYTNIEPAFQKVVRTIGGDVVTDLIPHPTFQNADFLFTADNLVAELKCLDTDTALQDSFRKSMADIMSSVPKGHRGSQLPEDTQQRIGCLYKKRLERVVEKANRQIRETAAHFKMPDALGVLLLANNNDSSLRFEMVRMTMGHFVRKFDRINLVVFLSLNKLVTANGSTHRAWIEMNFLERKLVPSEWKDRVLNGLLAHVGAEQGVTPKIKDLSQDEILSMEFVRRTPIYDDRTWGKLW